MPRFAASALCLGLFIPLSFAQDQVPDDGTMELPDGIALAGMVPGESVDPRFVAVALKLGGEMAHRAAFEEAVRRGREQAEDLPPHPEVVHFDEILALARDGSPMAWRWVLLHLKRGPTGPDLRKLIAEEGYTLALTQYQDRSFTPELIQALSRQPGLLGTAQTMELLESVIGSSKERSHRAAALYGQVDVLRRGQNQAGSADPEVTARVVGLLEEIVIGYPETPSGRFAASDLYFQVERRWLEAFQLWIAQAGEALDNGQTLDSVPAVPIHAARREMLPLQETHVITVESWVESFYRQYTVEEQSGTVRGLYWLAEAISGRYGVRHVAWRETKFALLAVLFKHFPDHSSVPSVLQELTTNYKGYPSELAIPPLEALVQGTTNGPVLEEAELALGLISSMSMKASDRLRALELMTSLEAGAFGGAVRRRARSERERLSRVAVGTIAPSLVGTNTYKQPVDLSRSLGKTATLVHFFEIGIDEELEFMKRLDSFRKLHGNDLRVFGVAYDRSKPVLQGGMFDHGFDWPVLWIGSAPENYMETWVIPKTGTVYMLDGEGRIQAFNPSLEEAAGMLRDWAQ